MKFRRIIALSLSLILGVVLLSGCSSQPAENNGNDNGETYKFAFLPNTQNNTFRLR